MKRLANYCRILLYIRGVDYRDIVNVSALKVHMSNNAYDAVKTFPEFITEPRGDILIKVQLQLYYYNKRDAVTFLSC